MLQEVMACRESWGSGHIVGGGSGGAGGAERSSLVTILPTQYFCWCICAHYWKY
ncbi:MAG: hypothetical protein U0T36_07555 [Saprospiraceae bacterium]